MAKHPARACKGLSIGFRPIEYAYIDEGGVRFTKWEWYELSVVTVPANAEGTIQTVKSIDERLRAASGNEQTDSKNNKPAGATAPKLSQTKGINMNISEQIKTFETKRATLDAERQAVMSKSFDEGRTLDAEEEEKYDELTSEIKSVNAHGTPARSGVGKSGNGTASAEDSGWHGC